MRPPCTHTPPTPNARWLRRSSCGGCWTARETQERPIWITEVGWASGGQPSGLTVGPERQAEYLTRTFELAAGQRERLRLGGVIWFALSDTPGPLWPGHCGRST